MGKTLFVTGASSEIGTEVIREIHDNYDTVIAHYRTMNDGLSQLKENLLGGGTKLICVQADLADEEQTKRLVDEVRALSADGMTPDHILHLPAEQIRLRRFHKTPWETFQHQINISIRSAVMVLSGLLPDMIKAGGGKVVIMLSMAVNDPVPKYHADYVMIKSALLSLVKSLATEYEEKGITVNGISPGWVRTKYIEQLPDYLAAQKAEESPTGGLLLPKDIVPTIEFLFSEKADHITGQNLSISWETV